MRRPRGLAVGLLGATLLLEAAAVVLSWGREPLWDTLLYAVFSIAQVAAGALIVSRQPTHAVGWLFCAAGALNALMADAAQGWALAGADLGWPGVALAELMVTLSWAVGGIALTWIFLLFPTGLLLGRRWGVVGWIGTVGGLIAMIGWSFNPVSGPEFSSGENPYALAWLPSDALLAVGMVALCGGLLGSVGALVLRLRRAVGVERQQLKWFTFAAGLAAVVLPAVFVFWYTAPLLRPLTAVVLTLIPVAACLAIVRYRLYDVDLVISRAVSYAALTALLAAAYVIIAVLLGTLLGRGSSWVTAAATLAVAVAFRPVRAIVQARVDRVFDRDRAAALRQVSVFLESLRTGHAEPEGVQAVLREALTDPDLELRLLLPDGELVDMRGSRVVEPADGDRARVPARRGDALLGEVVYAGGAQRDALAATVVDAAGLGIEIARLRVELRRRLDEVTQSRARIVAVADEERRRLERDLHDGAQQRLVSIGLALRHAQHELHSGASTRAVAALDGAVAEVTVTIEELRQLAHGVRPARLDDGLGPALRELAQRTRLPVEVIANGRRFAPEVETAAYFVACEAVTNAVKHAAATRIRLEVSSTERTLVLSVADDGTGDAHPRDGGGLTGLFDRVAAQGGTLRIDAQPGEGTRLTAELPCAS